MENISKVTIAHVVGELVVIGGLSYFFNKKLTEVNSKVADLEKKIEILEKNGNVTDTSKFISIEQFNHFQQATTQHINNLYEIIRQQSLNQMQQSNIPQQKTQHPSQSSLGMRNRKNPHHTTHNNHNNSQQSYQPQMEVIQETNEEKYNKQTDNSQQSTPIEELEPNLEDVDEELADEYKELSDPSTTNVTDVTNITDLKNDDEQLSTPLSDISVDSPLEFVVPKTKKPAKAKTLKTK
jgi:outer membrane murein-binding lipoprotein Lpp